MTADLFWLVLFNLDVVLFWFVVACTFDLLFCRVTIGFAVLMGCMLIFVFALSVVFYCLTLVMLVLCDVVFR